MKRKSYNSPAKQKQIAREALQTNGTIVDVARKHSLTDAAVHSYIKKYKAIIEAEERAAEVDDDECVFLDDVPEVQTRQEVGAEAPKEMIRVQSVDAELIALKKENATLKELLIMNWTNS